MEIETWVISAGRAANVQRLSLDLRWENFKWAVPRGQGEDYEINGAKDVMEVDGDLPNLCGQRNAVLDHCHEQGKAAFLLDDDIKQLRLVRSVKPQKIEKVGLGPALDHLTETMAHAIRDGSHARLGGFASTQNWLYVMDRPAVETRALICQLFLVLPSDIRFDPDMEFTEDYDFAFQHIEKYGGVVRDNHVLVNADKKKMAGGHQIWADREWRDAVAREKLMHKWPDRVTWPHPTKGPTEVRVKWQLKSGSAHGSATRN